jgi:ferritin-like metal-binding protein YciE
VRVTVPIDPFAAREPQAKEYTMSLLTLKGFFIEQLKDLYSAESQLLEALPKMAEAATEQDLKDAFSDHLEETKGQKARLAAILEDLGEEAEPDHCAAMAGLIAEGSEVLDERANAVVRDVALIAAAQRVEHYEIAAYGTVIALAKELLEPQALLALQQTYLEEKAADAKLEKIAKGGWFTKGLNDEARSYDKDYRAASREGGSQSPLENWTKDDLETRAAEMEIEGRSKMTKDELVGAIRDAS